MKLTDYPDIEFAWPPSPAFPSVARHDLTGHRVWIAGDLHGRFEDLATHLVAVGFDPDAGDRLVLTGDLIDVSGDADNSQAADWLEKPWVYAVRGDQEQRVIDAAIHPEPDARMLADYTLRSERRSWMEEMEPVECARLVRALTALPVARELRLGEIRFGVVHADVPIAMSWPDFCDRLTQYDPEAVQTALGGRARIRTAMEQGMPSPSVVGVDWLVIGHTPIRRRMIGRTLLLGNQPGDPPAVMALHRIAGTIPE